MRQVSLPGTERKSTTQLGFGCAYLLPETAYLLEVAYDAGVRHFDVARSYGRGFTEGLLGKFLQRHDDVTFTTKYGILPPANNAVVEVLRGALRPLVRELRRSAAISRTVDSSIQSFYNRAAFTPEEMEASLYLSLRRLRRDRVDLFLMHEADATCLSSNGLLKALERLKSQGVIGAFGVGGEAGRIPELVAQRPALCNILQYNWTAADPRPHTPGFDVIYRTFSGKVAAAKAAVKETRDQCNAWSARVGADLADRGTFERLMLKAALDDRPDAIVLFSSGKPENIRGNVAVAGDASLSQPAKILADLVRSYPLSEV